MNYINDKVRSAVVRVSGQERQTTTLHRPMQLLYLLEVAHHIESKNEEPVTTSEAHQGRSPKKGNRNKHLLEKQETESLLKC